MKIYNKKGFWLGIFWVLLAIGCAVADLRRPDPNMLIRVRDWVLTVFVFLLGISSFWRAFSRSATREDRIEEMDERNRLVEVKSKARMLDFVYGTLFVLVVGGLIGFQVTASEVWLALFIIPGFLLGLFVLVHIFIKLYYNKHE